MRRHRIIDPLAALSERQIRRRARNDVSQAYSPLIAALGKRAQAGYANIEGIANELANRAGAYQGAERDIYQRARDSLGAYNTATNQALGAGQADELRKRLAAAGLNSADADQFATSVGGAQGAGTARGGAELQALVGRQAAAEENAAKQPGIDRLAGLQQVGERQARYQQNVADLESHIPGEIAQAIQHSRDLELQKATANLGFRGDIYKVQAQNARANAANRIRLAAIRAANERTGMTLAERARHNGVSEREQAARDAEHARHDRQQERQQHQNAQERQRHNRQTEKGKKKGKSGGSSFWDQ